MEALTVEDLYQKEKRQLFIHATLRSMGIDTKDVEIVKDCLGGEAYRIEILRTREYWIKRGASTTSRIGEMNAGQTIIASVITALQDAEKDPLPKRRRLP